MGEALSATPRPPRAWVPGLIAGASDADPTTVVAIAVVGATTPYGLSWVVFSSSRRWVVQTVASRLGTVTGNDLQSVVWRAYGRRAQILVLVSLLVVNKFTVTADLAGSAAAVGLLTGASWRWLVLPLAAALRPLAGAVAGGLFAVELLASGLVVLPVVAATSAYVVGAQSGWRRGLSLPVLDARPSRGSGPDLGAVRWG